jgi:hypothetical protein
VMALRTQSSIASEGSLSSKLWASSDLNVSSDIAKALVPCHRCEAVGEKKRWERTGVQEEWGHLSC